MEHSLIWKTKMKALISVISMFGHQFYEYVMCISQFISYMNSHIFLILDKNKYKTEY